jgi:hypothetical protein
MKRNRGIKLVEDEPLGTRIVFGMTPIGPSVSVPRQLQNINQGASRIIKRLLNLKARLHKVHIFAGEIR